MGFEGLKKTDTNEQTEQTTKVENISNNQRIYNKPELENFHKTIIKNYPQSNENDLQTILKKLDQDIGDKLLTQGFDIIKELLQKDPDFLGGEKTTSEINKKIEVIKKEVNIKETSIDTESTSIDTESTSIDTESTNVKIKQTKQNIDDFYTQIPEQFKDQKGIDDFEKKQETQIKLGEIRNKLKAGNINEKDYIKNRYTALQLSQDITQPIEKKTEFIKEFNKLNKLLDIDIEIPILETRKLKNIETKTDSLDDLKTNADQVLTIPTIKTYVEDNENIFDTINISDINMLKFYTPKDIQISINKALNDGGKTDINIQEYFEKGVLNKDKIKENVDKESYDIINKTIISLIKNETNKNTIKNITNTTAKEKIITNVFKGLSGYFDINNDNAENFADDFKLNIEKDIKMDGKTFNLNGTINGYNVNFYYNMETGSLEMDDIVHLDDTGIYKIGQKNGGKFTLPTKLPTYQELTDITKTIDINKIIEDKKIDNLDTYKKAIEATLDDTMSQKFSHTELNKYYIKKYNEKNLAMQESLGYIFDNLEGASGDILIDFNETQEFASETKPNQYNLLRIIDKSIDYYNQSGQSTQFRNASQKFNTLIHTDKIQDSTKGCKEPIINKLFNEEAIGKSAENRKNIGEKENNKINYTTFYEIISNDTGIINLRALEQINNLIEKDETIEQHNSEFSNDLINKYNTNRKADNDLTESLNNLK